ncbi:MAG TPA: ketoacyl-ACP synthase III [Prolixibacteraceae bacterium]|nr:ketoacyl-ACP synthase III [Prolixibacteraceae bacterium]
MDKAIYTVIIGSGSCIPEILIKNEDFLNHEFYDSKNNEKIDKGNTEIIQKFQEITNIEERRWARDDQMTSDLGALAAKDAFDSSGIDPESIDFIIVGHNFGDIDSANNRSMLIPTLSARVKQRLNIKNPSIVAFDVLAGCPGWVQAMIVADSLIKSGNYKRGLVVGADVNSRVGDPHDRDLMIFADGAGAVIVEAKESETPVGILSHAARTDAVDWAEILVMGSSLNPDYDQSRKYIRMQGHKVYIYALQNVPGVAREALDKAGLHLSDIKKVLIHQANEKMDEAICQRLMKLYKMKGSTVDIMPMTIGELGNTSAATIPTMYDLIKKGKMKGHAINSGDNIILTSVGSGMNINAIIYREL